MNKKERVYKVHNKNGIYTFKSLNKALELMTLNKGHMAQHLETKHL